MVLRDPRYRTRGDPDGRPAQLDIYDVATKSDLAVLGAKVDGLQARLASVESIVNGLGTRIDRMFLAMLAGLFVIVATMAGVLLTL